MGQVLPLPLFLKKNSGGPRGTRGALEWPASLAPVRAACGRLTIVYQLDLLVLVPGGSCPVDWLAAWPDGPGRGDPGRWSIAEAVPVCGS